MTILSRIDVLQKALRVVAIACVALAVLFVVMGWRVDAASITSFVSSLAPRSSVQRGENLYGTYCSTCHGGADTTDRAPYPPAHNASGHTWRHSDCELLTIVQNGINGTEMPAFRARLEPDDIRAVLSYIKTLWTPEQRTAQENTTRAACPSA